MTKGHQNYRRTICDQRFGFALPRGVSLEDSNEHYPSTKYPRILSAARQRALGEFWRKHRETATRPTGDQQVGERRRRTSGLRREEVAQLARISSTWYARLEQGQEVRPSGAALGRIAEVLRLGDLVRIGEPNTLI